MAHPQGNYEAASNVNNMKDRFRLFATETHSEQQVTGQEHSEVDSEELNKEESSEADKGDQHGDPVSKPLGSVTSDLESNDVSDLRGDT